MCQGVECVEEQSVPKQFETKCSKEQNDTTGKQSVWQPVDRTEKLKN